MKKNIGILFIALLLLVGGIGVSNYFSSYVFKSLVYSHSMLEKTITDTLYTHGLVADLDKGNVEKVKQLLNLEIDTQILKVSEMLSHTDDEKTKKYGYEILGAIAQHREKYPYVLSESHHLESDISNILRKALLEKNKTNNDKTHLNTTSK